MVLLCVKFLPPAPGVLENCRCTFQKRGMIATVLSWDVSPACGLGVDR